MIWKTINLRALALDIMERCFAREITPERRARFTMTSSRARLTGQRCRGTAWYADMKIRVNIGPNARKGDVMMLVLHEVTHLAVRSMRAPGRRRRNVHGRSFNVAMCRAAESYFGISKRHARLGGYRPTWDLMEILCQKYARAEVREVMDLRFAETAYHTKILAAAAAAAPTPRTLPRRVAGFGQLSFPWTPGQQTFSFAC